MNSCVKARVPIVCSSVLTLYFRVVTHVCVITEIWAKLFLPAAVISALRSSDRLSPLPARDSNIVEFTPKNEYLVAALKGIIFISLLFGSVPTC